MYFSMIFLINNSMQKNSNSQIFSIFCIQMGEAWYSPSVHNRRWTKQRMGTRQRCWSRCWWGHSGRGRNGRALSTYRSLNPGDQGLWGHRFWWRQHRRRECEREVQVWCVIHHTHCVGTTIKFLAWRRSRASWRLLSSVSRFSMSSSDIVTKGG
jgi:hypothetical protein